MSLCVFFSCQIGTLCKDIFLCVGVLFVFERGALTPSSVLAKINRLSSVLSLCITRNQSVPQLNPQMTANHLPMADNVYLKQRWSELVNALGAELQQLDGNSLTIYGMKIMAHI
jgi:hypothetical protein